MSDIGSLPATVMQVLSSASARRINFHLGTIHVDGAGLLSIGVLVVSASTGRPGIGIEVDGAMERGVAAQYSPRKNRLIFPRKNYGITTGEKLDIVHECVHALQDVYGGGLYPTTRGSRFVTESENEAAAYIAGQLYSLYETGRTATSSHSNIFYLAGLIAKRIKDTAGAFVTLKEAEDLRREIVDNRIYPIGYNTLTFSNGL